MAYIANKLNLLVQITCCRWGAIKYTDYVLNDTATYLIDLIAFTLWLRFTFFLNLYKCTCCTILIMLELCIYMICGLHLKLFVVKCNIRYFRMQLFHMQRSWSCLLYSDQICKYYFHFNALLLIGVTTL